MGKEPLTGVDAKGLAGVKLTGVWMVSMLWYILGTDSVLSVRPWVALGGRGAGRLWPGICDTDCLAFR